MLYTFASVVVKSNDWKVASIKGADGVVANEVSINRVNKKGETFPRFDEIADGAQLEGNLWTSDSGKNYLFAPKAPTERRGGGNSKAITEAQDRKKGDIREAMDSKEYAIKVSGTARDATLITVELMKERKLDDWYTIWTEVREKLWAMYDRERTNDIF